MPVATGFPATILIGRPQAAPADNITRYVDWSSIRVEESGNHEPATAEFDFLQIATSVPSNAPANQFVERAVPEGTVLIRHGSDEMFLGFIRQIKYEPEGISRRVRITAADVTTLLDKSIIGEPVVRAAGESDRARIKWLFANYGWQIWRILGNVDYSFMQVLRANMPRQRFANITLRQAVEQVLGAASPTSNYYWDPVGRPHTFDAKNPEALTAPYRIHVTQDPAWNECPPMDLSIERDTSGLINAWRVRGKNAAGTTRVGDRDSQIQYGLREGIVDGPDADTLAKGKDVGQAALADSKDPLVRGFFAVEKEYAVRNGAHWHGGQKVYVTSAVHGLLAEPFRIIRVTTSYLSGKGDRRVEVEFGARRPRWLTGGSLQ